LYYTIYRITNKLNGKTYVGKHQTKDLQDGYMGSGKLITLAIKKRGAENFVKEILFVFDNEQDMNAKEKELVVIDETTYNLCPGGKNGWGYVNENGLSNTEKKRETSRQNIKIAAAALIEKQKDPEFKRKMNKAISDGSHRDGRSFKGKTHSLRTKKLMSVKAKLRTGKKNSQFGTKWVTNERGSIKISADEVDLYISLGYILGRQFLLA